jgi:uncharacterized membrane protein YecN with MAPEG domain
MQTSAKSKPSDLEALAKAWAFKEHLLPWRARGFWIWWLQYGISMVYR